MHILDSMDGRKPCIGAHRGYSTKAPENTLVALRTAATAGAAVCEVDVRRSADGTFLLMHDRDLARTTNGSGLVARQSWSELAMLDAGSWFAPAFAGEPIPTLRDGLELARTSGFGLLLEIKDQDADAVWIADCLAEVRAHGMIEHCLFTAFDHTQLLALKAQAPDARTMGILHARVVDVVALARAARLDAVILEARFHHADDVRALHAAGIAVAYSVQPPASYASAAALGAPDLAEFHAAFQDRQIGLVIGDDVDWIAAQLAHSFAAEAPPSAA